ncbi:Glycosyl hydrolase BNR repeat-containing protein [Croceitalea dokdonensis DOKDO 023]|uniref:Glycosyl hydrolase BNR repeat-containing protein n=1 Tax=Croceitalea dokdonensis DOKDO 023 TaxID=1300341 RepID=A0A0P7B037_9FLAO|nr:glycosyl hydrolase [Croceitalea dokdonensis]KPM32240.1 Glycosyl hydrolase BNR repeat-containing protein [Croceitalea dokdonensis DOKDO 023]
MRTLLFLVSLLMLLPGNGEAQRKKKKSDQPAIIVTDSMFTGLKWRNIGPFRGGRSVASTGVVGRPMTYYMGSTGGGIYKTTDDGITWKNISDGQLNTGTVGAIAVAESNPNIVVAGMGEHAARGVMTSMGDGVYKSTDAGKTWKHMGLDESRHISDVIIHPTQPDIMFVSVQGAQYGPSAQRGVYRTTNGGENWERVLYIDEHTGASSLSMDMTNPLILYATMWEHRRYPWLMESGGPSSGIYKSVDGGSSWKQLKEGLPKVMGKMGISVSRANPERVFAVIEAEGDKSGVYRSDDAGKKWKQVNKDRINITRSWYYMEIFADPQNEDIVYVLNAPMTKSIDGGMSFTPIPTPHGDNHHLWIHPYDNQKMINSNDGGANVSNNGGKSWSTQQNQATSQFYRVITDNVVPYHVYGGQQDNSAIAIASRTNDAGIDWKDWYSVAGCESAFLAFDPDDPEVVYGGCYQGIIEKWVKASREGKPIKEYPELGLGKVPRDFKYRYNWNAPIISSPHDRNTIYHAGNVVFKTNDGGQNWEVISPDLTRNEKDKQGPGGAPFTNEAAGGENYNTLMYLVESPHEKGVLYAGSDDGLLHITKDGGANWLNVTPPNIGNGIINSIEVSPHDAATAYIAVMRYKSMDLRPYIFKTADYGQTWTKITNGISDKHTFVRVVREDKKKKGLLYAGTETGLYVSMDDGQFWQKLQLNLPLVPINDLIIQDNDLVAATAGRSFWILDDLGAIQDSFDNTQSLRLVTPKPSYRIFGGSQDKPQPGLGQNPKSGVTIDYFLPKKLDTTTLVLDIIKDGKLIRSYSSTKPKAFKSWAGGPSKPAVLPTKKGYNRFTWDLRTAALPSIENVFVFGNSNGYRVGPGSYTIRMTLKEEVVETTAVVLADPKISGTPADYLEQENVLQTIDATVKEMHQAVNQMRSAKKQLIHYEKLLEEHQPAKELLEKSKDLKKRITSWEENLIQPKQKTFQDVINFNNQLNADLLHLKGFVDVSEPKVTSGAKQRLKDLLTDWGVYKKEKDDIVGKEMREFNQLFKTLDLPALILADE